MRNLIKWVGGEAHFSFPKSFFPLCLLLLPLCLLHQQRPADPAEQLMFLLFMHADPFDCITMRM